MPQVTQQVDTEKKPVKPTAHFTALQSQIAEALSIAEFGVAEGVSTSQRGVLIATSRNRLTLSAYDFMTAVSVTMPAETPVAKGYSLLDFAEMKRTLAAMVAGETKTVAARTPVALKGDLLVTEHISIPITTLDIHEFSHPPEAVPSMATVDAQVFLAQLNRVLPAAGSDITLPALTGVQMTLEGETLTMAATDRYRFAVGQVPARTTVQPTAKRLTSLIPAEVLAPLAKRLKSYDGLIGIGFIDQDDDASRATVSMGATTITMRSLEGVLPKHTSLFPTTCDASVCLERATLLRAVKKASALIKAKGEKGSPVTLTCDENDGLTLAPRVGTTAEQARIKGMSIPAIYTHGTPADRHGTQVSFNPNFLLTALGTFTGDTLTLHLPRTNQGQVVKPVLLTDGPEMTGDGYQHLLMPVRLAS